ncbi:hypothetical protein AGOR_G00101860 [Albula goreensis]|uniref:Phospholipase A2 n=1 Tax=Albula goreensis TaxID=1534307 RepID=A0A8T3DDW9_9TELE|nr:hypothetical protein AGOR_G00101860 [Albula goreensis]
MYVRASRIVGQVLPVLSAAFLRQKERSTKKQGNMEAWREEDPYWKVTVRVIRATNIPKQDYLSESDCYVSLRLPTASSKTYRTRTVPNSRFPEWNETFHFRVHSHVKNILELNVYDGDWLTYDDLCSTVLFDLNNLFPGKIETKVFTLDPKDEDELWVEFEMKESEEPPGNYITNGVLVAGLFSQLEVKVDEPADETDREALVLKLSGAYEEEPVVLGSASTETQPVLFHFNRDLETELEVKPLQEKNEEIKRQKIVDEAGKELQGISDGSTIPLSSLLADRQVTLSVPVGAEEIDLHLKTKDSSEELDVRLGFDIPLEEKRFLEKRREVVSEALQRALHLSSAPDPQQVPAVAVKLRLLDAISYITSVSGSTWALSSLYADANWSQEDLESPMSAMKAELNKSVLGLCSPTQLAYYFQELQEKGRGGQLVSFIDVLGLIFEYVIHGKKNPSTLSDQQRAVEEGQNPYPIYTAVNVKKSINGSQAVSEWCEFTPYEVGIPKYGGFVRTEDFGSEFYMGHLIKRHAESRISFLLGLWSSVLSFNLRVLVKKLLGSVPSWISGLGDDIHNTDELHPHKPSALHTYFIEPVGDLAETLDNVLTNRPIISQRYNFLRGFNLHWNYSESNEFLTWQDTHLDSFPNSLTPSDSTLQLVDSGFAMNVGFPPVMRPQRHVDLILSFNYSWNEDQFEVLKKTAQYCAERKLPFPHIDFSSLEGQEPRECYLFRDEQNPAAPMVLHFPLTNASFREYSAPGVKRVGEVELQQGEVDLESSGSPYRTANLMYAPEDFERLAALTTYNVTNNEKTILHALRLALHKHTPEGKPAEVDKHSPRERPTEVDCHTPEDKHVVVDKHTPEEKPAPVDKHTCEGTPV